MKPLVFLLFSLLTVLIILRFFFYVNSRKPYQDGEEVDATVTLFSEPKPMGKFQTVTVYARDAIRLYAPYYPKLHYGDSLNISGKVTLSRQGVSNQKQRLPNKRTATMFFPKIERREGAVPLSTGLAVVSTIRQHIIVFFEKTLPVPSGNLLLGIVFGIKQQMPQQFTSDLQKAGVFHVIAASGMNVTMVGGFLSSFFAFFLKRQHALIASMLGICFYAVLAGLEPSILRASIMGIIAFSAQILGRQPLALYGLFLASYLMLFISPILLFDVGFQLSVLATLGLLIIKPLLEGKPRFKHLLNKSIVGEDVVTTTAAQIATLPILLFHFGTYSLWSIAANALVLWTVPTLMVLGGIGSLISFVSEFLGKLFLFAALPFLLYFQNVVAFSAKLGGIALADFPWQMAVSYYLFLGGVLLAVHRGKKQPEQ